MRVKVKLLALIVTLGLLAAASFMFVEDKIISSSGAVISLLVTGIGIYILERQVFKPLKSIVEFNRSVAQGDFTVDKLKITSTDEFGDLAESANKMLEAQRSIMVEINNATYQVRASSQELVVSGEQVGRNAEQVGLAIEQVAHGSEEQTSQIADIASNSERLIEQIDLVSKRATEMSEVGDRVMNNISQGTDSVSQSVGQMESITNKVGGASDIVKSLGEKSTEVGDIVSLINGIAEQTNLLALNAAIEAARAGENGRGFAVVAEEVRKLAEDSADSTEKITILINEIQADIANAVEQMEASTDEVKSGSSAIQKTGQVFETIKNEAQSLANYIEEVTKSTQMINTSSVQVEKAVQEIASLSEEFAASAEEVAASSETQVKETDDIVSSAKYLAEMAQRLSNSVAKFNLSMGIEWNEDLAVGVYIIDDQHKELFNRINNLLEACNLGKGKDTVDEIIKFLEDYVVSHFGEEEEIMKKHDYPYYQQHKEQHEQFVEQFSQLKNKLEKEGVGGHMAIYTNQVVVDWLQDHIIKVDKALGEFLNKEIT